MLAGRLARGEIDEDEHRLRRDALREAWRDLESAPASAARVVIFRSLDAAAPIHQRDRVSEAPFAPTLPLILARELASNLATPMFLVDPRGMLVFYNDAAERVIGMPFAELGTIDAMEFGSVLQMARLDGEPVPRRLSPAGIAFNDRKPSHQELFVTGYDGTSHTVEATAYPLIGGRDELHGVVVVFWEPTPADGSA